ncbi:aminotransferase class I/II-fold pyridoxal phosphate-dependent enzyme [Acetatifactor muris]|uniref:Histidinol-phosphate aminotransferase n=1 Tax=Acetatifactor muris TaxID=879566 RepID=A0A2K4ZAR7_9FIRM|nr:aminotransferase class I/II-fold pyridoxal phosphate-dependent enzyme [Acetatifactor muris]MCI8799451.1 aminotransferase class I/II-fold pyridoxal phosphate-dependent enzyme [Lachnospiraceae bacterium]MCR2048737.1 aminotransferase class I/II-fold pyridoxal phosphate-dependent enzyme [Acetatifactor muris]SOY27529.1 Histidinol-phosphate aminotransferase [Acetatifactor muris]
MRIEEFNILYAIHKLGISFSKELIAEKTGYGLSEIDGVIEVLKNKNWLDEDITDSGYAALDEYKVDNAIIMAAGFGLRSLPLSRYVPKGLYVVKGEVLIERQIRQLLEAGIKEIVVVVGYLKEQFKYLQDKYGVIIVENDDYYRYNNISSLYASKDYLKNSFICCSDNYFNVNIFEEYVYDSYYSCKYTKEYAEEYCVTKMEGDYIAEIHKGGSNAWYTIGEAYFSKSFSSIFLKYLESEYENSETKKMLWDDFHIRHIEELPLLLVKYDNTIVQEFDTVEDVAAFDPDFRKYQDRILESNANTAAKLPTIFVKYDDVERYNSAVTDQHSGRLHLNENTFGPSPKCMDVLKEIRVQDLYEYDMASKDFLVEEISKVFSIPEDDIYIHNGSAELIKSVFSITLERGDSILVSNPGWSYYASLAREKFCNVYYYDVLKDDYAYYMDVEDILKKAKQHQPKIIVITSPHNPTGCKIDGNVLEMIIKENPDSLVLLDEAYWGFSEENIDVRRLVETYTNIIISRTFSKYYGLANMRVGYGFCNSKVKHIFGLDLPLFRESTLSRRMAVAAMHEEIYYEDVTHKLNEIKTWFMDELNQLSGVRVFQSCSNFVAVKIENADMQKIREILKENGILIRLFEDKEEVIARITISEMEIMKRTVDIFKENL